MMGTTQKTVLFAGALAVAGACVLYLVRKRKSSDSEKGQQTPSAAATRRKKSNTPTVTLTQSSEDGKQVSVLHLTSPDSQVQPKLDCSSTAPQDTSKSKDKNGTLDKNGTALESTSECQTNNNTGSSKGDLKDSNNEASDNIDRDSSVNTGSNLTQNVHTCEAERVSGEAIESEITEQKVKVAYVQPLNQARDSNDIQSQATHTLKEEQIIATQCEAELSQNANKAEEKESQVIKCDEQGLEDSVHTDDCAVKSESWGEQNENSNDNQSEPLTVQSDSSSSRTDCAQAVRTRSQSGNGSGNDQCHSSDSGVSVQSETEVSSPKEKTPKNSTTTTTSNNKIDTVAGGDAKANSTAASTNPNVFEFDFPTHMCGLLIGAKGKHIKLVMQKSGASVALKHKMFDQDNQIVTVRGKPEQIKQAMKIIKDKFPSRRTGVDYSPSKPEHPMLSPEMMQLSLPEGVTFDVIVSSVVTANHIFLQQPTHPTFHLLQRQNQVMGLCYSQANAVPELPRPIEAGVICASPMYSGWFRAQVVQTYPEQDECDIRFVDYGGYMKTQGSAIRQIRSDFTTLPFQAVECYLAHIIPPQDKQEFSVEANAVLEQMVQGQVVQAEVIGHESDGVPYVQLYIVNGDKMIFVNRELVNKGVARWVEMGV